MSAQRPEGYSTAARVMHWLVAGLLPVQVALGLAAERMECRVASDALFHAHFQLGVVLLALTAVRLGVRVLSPAPAHAAGLAAWQASVARWVHRAVYALLLLLPVSGYVIWRWMDGDRDMLGLVELPAVFVPPEEDESGRALAWYAHVYGVWLLMALVSLHVAAALWHQRVQRDRFIGRRMGV